MHSIGWVHEAAHLELSLNKVSAIRLTTSDPRCWVQTLHLRNSIGASIRASEWRIFHSPAAIDGDRPMLNPSHIELTGTGYEQASCAECKMFFRWRHTFLNPGSYLEYHIGSLLQCFTILHALARVPPSLRLSYRPWTAGPARDV
jgi:hypothetical protein